MEYTNKNNQQFRIFQIKVNNCNFGSIKLGKYIRIIGATKVTIKEEFKENEKTEY